MGTCLCCQSGDADEDDGTLQEPVLNCCCQDGDPTKINSIDCALPPLTPRSILRRNNNNNNNSVEGTPPIGCTVVDAASFSSTSTIGPQDAQPTSIKRKRSVSFAF